MLKLRVEKIKEFLNQDQAAIITSDANRLYFTGFTSSAGTVVITPRKAVFFIDFRYFEKAKSTVRHIDTVLTSSLCKQISELLHNDGIKEILIEADALTVSGMAKLKKALPDYSISSDASLSRKITELRYIKSDLELENIKKAQLLTDKTFSYILDRIAKGRTEKEIMLDMEFFIRKNGSEGVAFDFIVVSGKNSSLPHGVPTDKAIEKGDFITMDFGAVVNGYRSDMTRTVALNFVTEEQEKMYNTVLRAQLESLKAIKKGAVCCEVDRIARDIIASAGYGDCFGHGLGHSVGLEIHESPALNTRDTTPLESGMIMTVEPGIYLENKFGVRIEDMVYITNDGHINLTAAKKDLIII